MTGAISLTLAGGSTAKGVSVAARAGCTVATGTAGVATPRFLRTIATGETGWFSSPGLVDLNGDGKSDLVWQHTDGSVQAWLMDGLTITQIGSLTGAGTYMVVPPTP